MANCDTGHLISSELFEELRRERLDGGYREVPDALSREETRGKTRRARSERGRLAASELDARDAARA